MFCAFSVWVFRVDAWRNNGLIERLLDPLERLWAFATELTCLWILDHYLLGLCVCFVVMAVVGDVDDIETTSAGYWDGTEHGRGDGEDTNGIDGGVERAFDLGELRLGLGRDGRGVLDSEIGGGCGWAQQSSR